MGKFKGNMLRGRVTPRPGRVKPLSSDPALIMTPERAERRILYDSPRWKKTRRELKDKMCWAGCGRYATVLDHMFGHDDQTALDLAAWLRVPIRPTWEERFFHGPFISLCEECHGRKTWHEQRGRLGEWLAVNRLGSRTTDSPQ